MKTLICILILLNLSILSVNANDALLDNIANSGARNFETIRKGWAPTQEEIYSRRLMELRIQQQEQENRRYEYQLRRLQELEAQRRKQQKVLKKQSSYELSDFQCFERDFNGELKTICLAK